MENRVAKQSLSAAVLILLLTIFSSALLQADGNNNAGIIFLQLHISKDGITFVRSSLVPGTLKSPRAGKDSEASGIYYDVESKSGLVIASGRMDNPLIRRVEYEDPDTPGVLRSKVIELTETDFVLRLGYSEDIASVSFYEVGRAVSGFGERSSRKLLGKIVIDFGTGGGE